MGKSAKSNPSKLPSERKIRTRSATLRLKSADDSSENYVRPFFDQPNNPPREYTTIQSKVKFFPNDEDIDIYFASCFNPTTNSKDETFHNNERELSQVKSFKQRKKTIIQLSKNDVFDEGGESQVKSSLGSIEEEIISQKNNFEIEQSQSPEFPIFGRMKDLRTPPNKMIDLKDFDQSEQIGRRNFIDQLEDVSKEISIPENRSYSPSPITISQVLIPEIVPSSPIQMNQILNVMELLSPAPKTEKTISKGRKTPSSKKQKRKKSEPLKIENIEFSFKRRVSNDEVRRSAQILRLQSLKSLHQKFERSERVLLSLDNALKTLMNYYQLKQINSKILTFRVNVYKLLKEQIDNMLTLVKQKKEICEEVIQEKSKNSCEAFHLYDGEMEVE